MYRDTLEPEAPSAAITQPEDDLVFETPFELNETQVMLQAESDIAKQILGQ